MEHIAELGGIVTGFNVTEQCIDCMNEKDLLKIDKYSRNIICQKTVFESEGLSICISMEELYMPQVTMENFLKSK